MFVNNVKKLDIILAFEFLPQLPIYFIKYTLEIDLGEWQL